LTDDLVRVLTAHYKDWFAALSHEGTGPLETLLADEWLYTNYAAVVRGKAEYLDWIAGTSESLVVVGPYDLLVRRYDDMAVVVGGYRVVHEPDPSVLELRFTGVWTWRDNRWQCLIHHNTELTD
jgi:hypothetical protein